MQLWARRVLLFAAGLILLTAGSWAVRWMFPGGMSPKTLETFMSRAYYVFKMSIGGILGLVVAKQRDVVDYFGHKLKMFKAGVLVNRHKLKEERFFDDNNAQKYCCEGVFGSDKDFMEMVDECFAAVVLVVCCVVWTIGGIILGQRNFCSKISWAIAITNLSRVLLPILRFHFGQD